MLNTVEGLMKKVDNMKEEIGNITTKMETLRKNQKEMLEIKNTVTEMNYAFVTDSSIDWIWLRKESVNLKKCQ